MHAGLYANYLVLWCLENYATTATYRMQLDLHNVTTWTRDMTDNKDKSTDTRFLLSTKQKAGTLKLHLSSMRTSLHSWGHFSHKIDLETRNGKSGGYSSKEI